MVAAPFTSQDLSPSPSSLLEFKEYQEYKEYQEFRGYTPPHLGVSSLKEQQVEETKKKVINGFISFKKIIINKNYKKFELSNNCWYTFDISNFIKSRKIYSLKYPRSTSSGCRDIGIRNIRIWRKCSVTLFESFKIFKILNNFKMQQNSLFCIPHPLDR